MKTMYISILLIVFSWACRTTPGPDEATESTEKAKVPTFRYHVNEPDRTMHLPLLLKEISGLSMGYNDNYLLAVQDEMGVLFVIDETNGSIKRKIPFAKPGDYEGVEVVGKDVYVLKNSGTLTRINNVDDTEQTTESFNTFLNKDNDVEGLGHDAANNRLLLACKGIAGTAASLQNRKAIYGFNLKTKNLDTLPVVTFGQVEVQKYLVAHANEDRVEKLVEFFADQGKFEFSTSSVAVHPLDGNLYLLSAVGNIFMVINFKGEVVYMEKMKGKLHKQPEGLCFDSKGGMYISNEAGEEQPGMIYYYKPSTAE